MKNILFVLSLGILLVNCGDESSSDCDGSISTVAGTETSSFDSPEQAWLVANAGTNAHELGVLWINNGVTVNLQLLIELGGDQCVPVGRYDLDALPSSVQIFSIQYASLGSFASVSNVFSEDSDTGYIEITKCDDAADVIDLKFGFSTTSQQSQSFTLSETVAIGVCFDRSK